MNPGNTIVVVAHYNEDISWVEQLRKKWFECRVYEKSMNNEKYNVPENKGQEASVYLKYIIDNYANLPEYTIFLHGHESSWHTIGNISDIIFPLIGKSFEMYSLNKYILGSIYGHEWFNTHVMNFYNECLASHLGPYARYGDWTVGFTGCAQFIVRKSVILKNSITLYQRMYDWIMESNLDNAIVGRLFEWTWNIVFRMVSRPVSKKCLPVIKANIMIDLHDSTQNINVTDIVRNWCQAGYSSQIISNQSADIFPYNYIYLMVETADNRILYQILANKVLAICKIY